MKRIGIPDYNSGETIIVNVGSVDQFTGYTNQDLRCYIDGLIKILLAKEYTALVKGNVHLSDSISIHRNAAMIRGDQDMINIIDRLYNQGKTLIR